MAEKTDRSEKTLARIEACLAQVAKQQEAICSEIAGLRQRVDALAGARTASTEEVIRFLDGFRAGEALGEVSIGAWIAATKIDCLRGGLRTVQCREGSHARLLSERIKELGGSPRFELPESVQEEAMRELGGTERTDLDKVEGFLARFGDAEKALAPIYELANRLDHDPETQWLLRTVAQDERSSITFFQEACALLKG